MNCKFENIEIKESLLNKMRHASYSKRYPQAKETTPNDKFATKKQIEKTTA